MLKKIILISLLLLTAASAQAQSPKAGKAYQSFQIDLNGDGKPEKVGLVAYRVGSDEYWGQLTVWDSSGKVLWQGPQCKKADEPLAFGAWNYGGSSIEAVGDLEGNGKLSVFAPAPQSDVRPTTYRIFHWDGHSFVASGRKQLLENPKGSGHFQWSEPRQWDGSSAMGWVGQLERKGKDLIAQIYIVKSGSDIKQGKARVTVASGELRVSSWVEKAR